MRTQEHEEYLRRRKSESPLPAASQWFLGAAPVQGIDFNAALLGGGNSNIFCFHPKNLGEMIHFDLGGAQPPTRITRLLETLLVRFLAIWGKTIRCCWVQIAHSWLETKKSLFLQTHGLNPENRFHGKISHRMASCRKTITWIHGFLFHWVPLVSAVYWRHFPSVGVSPPGADWEGVGFIVVVFCQFYQNASGEISSLSHNWVIHIFKKVWNYQLCLVPLVAASHRHRIETDCQIWRLKIIHEYYFQVHLRSFTDRPNGKAYSMMYLSKMTMDVMSIFVSTVCFGFKMLHPREKSLGSVWNYIYI